jgi:putative Mg2+ transporter-C (MgtC) family protein
MDTLFKIILSTILGLLIGYERESSGKSVGIRTISLICLGSTLFCLMSPTIFNGDNTRIIAQIVSGIGFLGAGIIFKNGDEVHGLTTAATIWATAAIGALVGSGLFIEAIVGSIFILVINMLFKFLKP